MFAANNHDRQCSCECTPRVRPASARSCPATPHAIQGTRAKAVHAIMNMTNGVFMPYHEEANMTARAHVFFCQWWLCSFVSLKLSKSSQYIPERYTINRLSTRATTQNKTSHRAAAQQATLAAEANVLRVHGNGVLTKNPACEIELRTFMILEPPATHKKSKNGYLLV